VVFYGHLLKLAFLWVKVQPVLMEMLQDSPCYTLVFSKGLQVDQDVIKVDAYQALHDEVSEDVIHHGLEGGWAISEAKEHYTEKR